MPNLFGCLLASVFANWQYNGFILRAVCRGVMTRIRKDPNKGDFVNNFRLISLLNAELTFQSKVLVKGLARVSGGLVGRRKLVSFLANHSEQSLPYTLYSLESVSKSGKG